MEKNRPVSVRQPQKVQRIRRGRELVLADLQVALGTLKGVVPQQRLNGHQVHPGF